MEITLLPQQGLKLKGKKVTFGIDVKDAITNFNAVLLTIPDESVAPLLENTVVLMGAGDYEVSGVKITGIRGGEEVVYSVSVEGLEIIIGTTEALEKAKHKIKEHHVAIISVSHDIDSAFATGLATNAVIFYGEKAAEVVEHFAKEGVKKESKYQVIVDKLPTEMETVLLQ